MKSARERLIIALDVETRAEAISLALTLRPFAAWMKIGLQLFAAEGPDIVRAVQRTGAKIFLDLKLHDIPNTVGKAVASVAQLRAQMVTVHLSGGGEMIRAAVGAAAGRLVPVGVTVLTSADGETLRQVGIDAELSDQVKRLASLGVDCGIGALVASAQDLPGLRDIVGSELKLICPGIRSIGGIKHDQKRTATAREAVAAGADYLVIGRPITAAPDPASAAEQILEELES